MAFTVPADSEPRATRYWQDEHGQKWRSMGNIYWFTNLDHQKRHENIILYKKYTPEEYPKYDNFEAIEVSQTAEIPQDYDGTMGVPITFMDKYNPEQFEIIGITQSWAKMNSKIYPKQIQIDKNGKETLVTKLNDCPSIKIDTPPANQTYYKVDNNLYLGKFVRLLIRKIKK